MPTEAEEEEEEKKKEKRPKGGVMKRWDSVPILYKFIAFGLLFLYYMAVYSKTGGFKQLIMVTVFLIVGLLMLGGKEELGEEKIISPELAEKLAREEIERKKRIGQFPYDMEYWLGPTNTWQKVDGKIAEYWIGALCVEGGVAVQRVAKVNALNGYCVVPRTGVGEFRGVEVEHVRNRMPDIVRFAKDWGIEDWLKK